MYITNLESFDWSMINGWLIIDLTREYVDILQWSKDHESEIIPFLKSLTHVNGLVLTTLHTPYFHKDQFFKSETNHDHTMYYFGYDTNDLWYWLKWVNSDLSAICRSTIIMIF